MMVTRNAEMLAVIVFVVISFINISSAQRISFDITYATCASPDGMRACAQEQSDFHTQCYANAGADIDKGAACDCVLNLGIINCALANCWNAVYGCEYQSLVKNYNYYCNSDPVPFYPAPEDAPGGCSCNIGHVAVNVTQSLNQVGTCSTQASGLNEITACQCCELSGAYTSLYDICPGVDLNLLEFVGLDVVLESTGVTLDQCGTYFNQFNCVNDLGYQPIGTLSYRTNEPTTTPTGTYSTTAGSITSPLSGATFTWTALGIPYAITAAAASDDQPNDSEGSTTRGSSSTPQSSSRGGAGSSAASSTSATTSATSTPNAGMSLPQETIGPVAYIGPLVALAVQMM